MGNARVELGPRSLPAGFAAGICGKKVVEAVRFKSMQSEALSAGRLKSRACDAMTAAGGSFSGWNGGSGEATGQGGRTGVGSACRMQRTEAMNDRNELDLRA